MNAKIMKGKSAGGLIDYLNSMKGQDGTSGNQFLAQRPGKAD